MPTNVLALALAGVQLTNTLIHLANQVQTGELTEEEAREQGLKAWEAAGNHVLAADQRWEKIDQAARDA